MLGAQQACLLTPVIGSHAVCTTPLRSGVPSAARLKHSSRSTLQQVRLHSRLLLQLLALRGADRHVRVWRRIEADDRCQLTMLLFWEVFADPKDMWLYPHNSLRNLALLQVG
jgi:hypothetical protein